VASNPADLLHQGIAAARSGQKETARRLLTQVVEQDENNVAAWLWLSGVADSLDDREVCLENVLTLDPKHQVARKGLEQIWAQKGTSATRAPMTLRAAVSEAKPVWSAAPAAQSRREDRSRTSPSAATSLDVASSPPSLDLETNSCPYCAAPTKSEDEHCRACHRGLVHTVYKRESPSMLYWIWIGLWAINVLLTAIACLAMAVAAWAPASTSLQYLSPDQAATYFYTLAGMGIFQLTLLVMVLRRSQSLYLFLLVSAAIPFMLVLVLSVMSFNFLFCFLLAIYGLPVAILLRLGKDFEGERRRLLCVADEDISSHSAFYARGQVYARKKMWALAAVHFRRAVGNAPGYAAYHMVLATAYAKLKRYQRALEAVREAKRIAPSDNRVNELEQLLEEAVAH
jgi:tetratricopeptide (TPR) repeat protein